MDIKDKEYSGERSLFSSKNLNLTNCKFIDGESPLKESQNIKIYNCVFNWKYPLWYCFDIEVEDSVLNETARSGIWYTNNISIKNSIIYAPKTFRRSCGIELENVMMPNALETMWNCENIDLKNVVVKGDYFCFNSSGLIADNLEIDGNYSFDGCKNLIIKNSKLISKDAFWNCKNVKVYNSIIVGEYLGWNSKDITFVNCKIESLQGLCYMDNVTLVDCELVNTTLAFEYSTVNANIKGDENLTIFNPMCDSTIKVDRVKEIILDEHCIVPSKVNIIVGGEENE